LASVLVAGVSRPKPACGPGSSVSRFFADAAEHPLRAETFGALVQPGDRPPLRQPDEFWAHQFESVERLLDLASIRHDLDRALHLACGNACCGPHPKGAAPLEGLRVFPQLSRMITELRALV
jgi:hypothetical protein